MTATTLTLPGRLFSDDTPLHLGQAVAVGRGSSYRLTSDNKLQQLVLGFGGVQVIPRISNTIKPFLVVVQPEDSELLLALNKVRSRLVHDLGIQDDQMKPIMAPGKGLLKNRPTLILNPTPSAIFKDAQQKPVDFNSVVGLQCRLIMFVQLQSVFKHADLSYSLQYQVCQMVLLEDPVAPVIVEQIQVDEIQNVDGLY